LELNKPNFIKNRVDLKAATVNMFASAINVLKTDNTELVSKETKVFLFTNFGVIEGDIPVTEEENLSSDPIGNAFFQIRNNGLAKIEEESEKLQVSNNVSIVTIRDAIIHPFNGETSSIGILYLFSDQIVGFTYGENLK